MKHLKRVTRRPATAQDSDSDLPFFISSLQLMLTVLTALQTKKLALETNDTTG